MRKYLRKYCKIVFGKAVKNFVINVRIIINKRKGFTDSHTTVVNDFDQKNFQQMIK